MEKCPKTVNILNAFLSLFMMLADRLDICICNQYNTIDNEGILYFLLRNRSERTQKGILFGLLLFGFALHFLKVYIPPYSVDEARMLRDSWFVNICGANIERIRKALGMKQTTLISKMQLMGVDINPSSLSKLEGQTRSATDIEIKAIATILGVTMEELMNEKEP